MVHYGVTQLDPSDATPALYPIHGLRIAAGEVMADVPRAAGQTQSDPAE
jgi:hypothetical protein